MMVVWIILEAMFLFLFFHLPTASDEDKTQTNSDTISSTHRSPQHNTNDVNTPITASDTPVINTVIVEDLSFKGSGNTGLLNQSRLVHSTHDMFVSHSQNETVTHQSSNMNKETTPLLNESGHHQDHAYIGLKSSDNNYGSINKEDVIIFNEEMNEDVPGNICYKMKSKIYHIYWMMKELIKEEIVLLLAFLFITLFDQLVLEVRFVILNAELSLSLSLTHI